VAKKKHNLAAIVVSITLIEGLAIYLNMVAHPRSQPTLTAVIVILIAIISGFYMRYLAKNSLI
jgi:uncharacterized membrane protein YqhA